VVADRRRTVAALVALAALSTACDRGSDAASSIESAADASGPSATGEVVPEGFHRTIAQLWPPGASEADVVELDVWFAGEPDQWQQGLTAVTDLDGADGMLFAFDAAAEYRFYMWQTPMPLDIYFFAEDGHVVASDSMEPCLRGPSSRCARYSPGVPFLLALEVPSGSLDSLAIDETWTIRFDAPVNGGSPPEVTRPASSGPPTSAPADG
jgi:uncharacterized membrane protein (UPF0127 family)